MILKVSVRNHTHIYKVTEINKCKNPEIGVFARKMHVHKLFSDNVYND